MAKIKKTLGEFLSEKNIVTLTQIQTAHLESEKTGESLSHVLVRLGMVPEDKILEYYTDYCNIPRADLSKIDSQVISMVPEKTARRYHLLPVEKRDNKLIVAMSDPLNIIVLRIEIRRKSRQHIQNLHAKYYVSIYPQHLFHHSVDFDDLLIRINHD